MEAGVLKLANVPASGSALTSASTIAAATGLDRAYPFRPYMAAYGKDKLLVGWKAGGKLVLAVADSTSGAVVEGATTRDLTIDQFQEGNSVQTVMLCGVIAREDRP
jgi:hypothetical protein